ncbi:PTS lactose transporter subunit IIB [Lentilactobacillus diolivorans]|mgnify:CR=1 FL=1|uniref:PTS sugar transporter subunit IIB n=1 Tax=Lentilactobacillus diolivorans TaxID=179838 RepID=UPI00246958A1|nr:PTS lactose transporter subunit IIB [Lentilactobacillus diolivorans]MDH5105719.1 PTS lactose transporter subunit IIB [Lentilactobacillus diolivorans]
MKNVLLICESGISSDFLVKSASRFLETYHASIKLMSTNVDNTDTYLDKAIDLVLIAPQASYHEKELEMIGGKAPVKTIPDDVYGWANGEKLVKFIMNQFSLAKVI